MMNSSEIAKVYETIMSIPGMVETVKIDLRMTRKNVLLLSHIIERGIVAKDDEKGGLLGNVSNETLQELKTVADDCLQKAGLDDVSRNIKELGTGK